MDYTEQQKQRAQRDTQRIQELAGHLHHQKGLSYSEAFTQASAAIAPSSQNWKLAPVKAGGEKIQQQINAISYSEKISVAEAAARFAHKCLEVQQRDGVEFSEAEQLVTSYGLSA